MSSMIITVSDEMKKISVDLEVPDLQMVKTLKEDIVETLNGYKPDLYLSAFSVEIFSNRLKRILNDHETFAQAGIWNGDYITLVRRRG